MKRKAIWLLAYGMLVVVLPAHSHGDSPGSYEIEVDDLADWERTYGHSDTLALRTVAASGQDATRVAPSGEAGEALVYKTQGGLRSFAVQTYGGKPGAGDGGGLQFLISADGKSYRSVTPDIHEEPGKSPTVTYASRGFPVGTKFLKIVFEGGGADASPEIGEVVLNDDAGTGAAASKPSGAVLYGSMVLLSPQEEGEAVYYTTDGSDPRTSKTRLLYGAPIAIASETVLKATSADPASGPAKESSGVSTYAYTPYPLAAPPEGIDDKLDDFGLTAVRANVYTATDNPAYYGGDGRRAVRATTGAGVILYKTEYDMTSFSVSSYYFAGLPLSKLKFYASSDDVTYNEVPALAYPSGNPVKNWQPYAYENMALPEGTRYLKIEMTGKSKAWTPQVSSVAINLNTASASLATTKTKGGILATLATETDGARLYYRLNDGNDFLPYTAPIALHGYVRLEAYAVKEGLLPSPVRSYAINASDEVQLDRFGQMEDASFAGKVTSESQLAADAKADKAYYDSLQAPAGRDDYGGLAGSKDKYGFKATGYFAIQRLNGRPVMTTPSGNLYFSLAVNGVTANETYSLVKGRETLYESVPPYAGEYKPAWLGTDSFSYYVANKYRKSGVFPTEHDIYMEAIGRLEKWGFNGIGGFSPEKYGEEGLFPYMRMLPLDSMSWAKIDGLKFFDIYAPGAETKLDQAFAQAVAPYKDDPMLVGYFIGNEYDFHKFYQVVPGLKASKAAIKGRLVQRLASKYGTIGAFNKAWGTDFASFDSLKEAKLPVDTKTAWSDMNGLFAEYLDRFYGTVAKLFRKYDSHHLLLGDRWTVTAFRDAKLRGMLAAAEGKYVDVISLNYYSHKVETELLDDLYAKAGKPIMMSEFGYGTSEQGLAQLIQNAASNQAQRGIRYRNYVEGVASLRYVVGANVFNYVDQAGLGRHWQGQWGEHYNSGLVNVADRPYKDYLTAAKATNDDIYRIMLGQRPKYFYDFNKK
ncbi:chitobiase/beta-hexosaminidase C-terminal domain-containing protein [Cohnella hashimotonis]|uniref:Chitobiase/beta-hexosaminidase C-terminal domain-containing protein n=1 Tax=Cohnella hashimotonis TaxID=2826895 RepID=A0ABT6TJC0_9BACL|nr:chitobiase/beta-hexosaminidase C-terminal domain-containing protein [Cohnella hashimotonis]MDI4646942.1 chitobiase/beta-hexosaminidase C-terminal domain-containing protein [Cohnella hashimotonis]